MPRYRGARGPPDGARRRSLSGIVDERANGGLSQAWCTRFHESVRRRTGIKEQTIYPRQAPGSSRGTDWTQGEVAKTADHDIEPNSCRSRMVVIVRQPADRKRS